MKYYYTIDLKGIATQKSNKKTQKIYTETLQLLDNLNLESTLQEISRKVIIDGAYYAYINVFPDHHITLTSLDPNYCRSRDKSAYGTDIVEFNLTYFSTYEEKDLKQTLNKFPRNVVLAYKEWAEGRSLTPWVKFDAGSACAFSFNSDYEKAFPRLFSSLIDIINYDDYKEIEKEKDKNELEKLLVQRFELDDDSDLTVLMEEMTSIHQAVSELMQDHNNIDVITTLAKEIELKDTQKTGQVSQNNLEKMLNPKYESSGLSYELFASDTATALERNLQNSTSFMSQLLYKYARWLSVLCYSQIEYGNLFPIVTLLPITWYNEDKMVAEYIKNAQYGYSWILPWVASGKKQSALTDTLYLEQEVLGLSDKMRPLSSSFTSSGDSTEGPKNPVGRPPLSNEDRSEKTLKNIDSQ